MNFDDSREYTEERERCPCNRHSSKSCQFASYSALALSVVLVFGVYFVLRCNPAEESWCRFKDHDYHEQSKETEYATLTLLVLLFAVGVIFLYVRSRFNPGMWNEEPDTEPPPNEPKPPEYEFIMESDMNMFARMKIMDPDMPPPTIRSAIKQPKVSEYRPPDFNETYGYPPDYAESTGIFECDSEGKSVLDDFGGGTASFLGSTSMFGSSMLNSRNDMSTSNYSLTGGRFAIARLTSPNRRNQYDTNSNRTRTTSENTRR